jgi:hypothetical protein
MKDISLFKFSGKMMWCATLQRCLELRLEEHAPILHSETGRQVFRKYKNVLTTIVQLGNNHLRNWALLNVCSSIKFTF